MSITNPVFSSTTKSISTVTTEPDLYWSVAKLGVSKGGTGKQFTIMSTSVYASDPRGSPGAAPISNISLDLLRNKYTIPNVGSLYVYGASDILTPPSKASVGAGGWSAPPGISGGTPTISADKFFFTALEFDTNIDLLTLSGDAVAWVQFYFCYNTLATSVKNSDGSVMYNSALGKLTITSIGTLAFTWA